METVDIAAQVRQGRGKGPARRLRKSGRIPATFYGPNRSPVAVDVDAKEFTSKVANLEGSHLIRIQSDVPELAQRVALIRGLQHHPVSGDVLHADLYEVDLTKKLLINVPLHFVGKAVGVAQQGGILQPVQREVEVECLPTDIPDFIEVDVSGLHIHDAIHVGDLKTTAGAEIRYDSNYTVVTVLAPTVEETKVEAAAEVAAEGAVPEAAAAAAPTGKEGAKGAA